MKAWITLVGVFAIVGTRVLGYAVERSKSVAADPAIWPESILDTDRRATIKLLLNGKMYAPDLDNILLDSEVKKSAEKIESCSSSSEESQRLNQRLKRSEDFKINGTQLENNSTNENNFKGSGGITSNGTLLESNSTNVTDLKESTIEMLSLPEAKTLDVTGAKTSDSESPRNVVLLLINDTGIGHETMWKNFETSQKFNVQGFLQNCRVTEVVDTDKASSGAPLVSGESNEECNCEYSLRANVRALLSWARDIKEMNTATIWATNFSNPLSHGTDSPTIRVKDLDENVETNGIRQEVPRLSPSIGNVVAIGMRQEVPRLSPRVGGNGEANGIRQEVPRLSPSVVGKNWPMIYPDIQSIPSAPSTPVLSPAKQEGVNGYDGMWDVFDMFSRIRIAFFRILLESLGSFSGNEDEFGTKKYFSLQPSVSELITDSLKDLETELNNKGFIMVITAQGNELSAAIDVLRREISIKDTLIVVAGMCSNMNESIPFFAEGPGDKILREARTIFDLPNSIRIALSNGCPGQLCSENPTYEIDSLTQDLPRKRVARANAEDETSNSTVGEKSTNDTAEEVQEKITPKASKRSKNGVGEMRVDTIASILGIVTSMTAALALNS